jgi:hypothetical protein
MRRAFTALLLCAAACAGSSGNDNTGTPQSSHPPPPDAGDACLPRPAGSGFQPACMPDFPHVRSNSGAVMNPLTMVTVVTANDPDADALFAFSDQVFQSQWWNVTAPEYALGPGTNSHVTGPAISTSVSQNQIQQYLANLVAAGSAPAPDGNTLYLFYLPAAFDLSSQGLCGYHSPWSTSPSAKNDSYAVISHCPPFLGETDLDGVTETASHEIFEAATDPGVNSYQIGAQTNQPWLHTIWQSYHDQGAIELGDLCEGTRYQEPQPDGGYYLYQRMWSNSAASKGLDPCSPALDQPYYNTAEGHGWYALSPGGKVQITATGWATDPSITWEVEVGLLSGSAAFAKATNPVVDLTSELGTAKPGPTCDTEPILSDGKKATLTVTAPPGAVAGDYATFLVYSIRRAPDTCHAPLTDDPYHYSIFGVYLH